MEHASSTIINETATHHPPCPGGVANATAHGQSIPGSSIVSRTYLSGDVAYTYDMHGWTTGITTNSFCEELFYADGPGAPRYGGDVSSMRWSSYEHSPKRGYKFSYDDVGRLTQATYGEGNTLTSNANRFSEGVQYDAHGNVTGIVRRGKTSAYTYGLMDNLTLAYDGDRLTGVTETAADYDFSGSFEYKGANGSQYMYNANGSLVADRSRGIAYIAYDDYTKKNSRFDEQRFVFFS